MDLYKNRLYVHFTANFKQSTTAGFVSHSSGEAEDWAGCRVARSLGMREHTSGVYLDTDSAAELWD